MGVRKTNAANPMKVSGSHRDDGSTVAFPLQVTAVEPGVATVVSAAGTSVINS